MELTYEVIWANVADSRLHTETGLTKRAMSKLCASDLCVIISVRIIWQ